MTLRVTTTGCSLEPSHRQSNTEVLLGTIVEGMRRHEATDYQGLRLADYTIKPRVEPDEGEGDEWPRIAAKMLAVDVLFFGTPIWVGHPSSVARQAMERMDSFLFHYDDVGQKLPYNRVAGVAVVGNEDGGHHVCAEVAQALIDCGFTVPTEARAYWTGWTSDSPGPDYAEAGPRARPPCRQSGEHRRSDVGPDRRPHGGATDRVGRPADRAEPDPGCKRKGSSAGERNGAQGLERHEHEGTERPEARHLGLDGGRRQRHGEGGDDRHREDQGENGQADERAPAGSRLHERFDRARPRRGCASPTAPRACTS